MRNADGSLAKTAIAVVLGLSSAALGACGAPPSAPKYGVPATEGPAPMAEPSTSSVPSAAPTGEVAIYGVAGTEER